MFKLAALQAGGSEDTGSATLFEAGKLVTNCHVTRGARRLEIFNGAARLPAEQYAADTARDICLLAVAGLDAQDSPTGAAASLEVGQSVYAVGFPGGKAQSVNAGEVLALHDYEGGKIVRTNAVFEPGASGGALFDGAGRLVGVLTFKASRGGAFHFALPVEWLRDVEHADAHSNDRAFWERSNKDQPAFLRAAALESAEDWSGLLEFGRRWSATETTNPEAWMARAKGAHYHKRGLADEAAFAYRQAAALGKSQTLRQHTSRKEEGYGCSPNSCVAALPALAEEIPSQPRISEN